MKVIKPKRAEAPANATVTLEVYTRRYNPPGWALMPNNTKDVRARVSDKYVVVRNDLLDYRFYRDTGEQKGEIHTFQYKVTNIRLDS